MTKREILQTLKFGNRVAEEERDSLATYFVETDQWRRIFNGEVDIVYGAKGSGKSALFSALLSNSGPLFDRGIIVEAAENPRGAPAFKELVDDPPATEREFTLMWKLHFLSLAGVALRDYGAPNDKAKKVIAILVGLGLMPADKERNLQKLVASIVRYVKTMFKGAYVEAELKFDPSSGAVSGIGGKLGIKPSAAESIKASELTINDCLLLADGAFEEMGYELWILLDRLDVAFADSPGLEENALRALFKAYLDLAGLTKLKMKVFLRTDIWRRITESGFREASHITRHVTIEWDSRSLLNLVVRRMLQNTSVPRHYKIEATDVLQSEEAQRGLFYRIFPDKVEQGSRKPATFDWMLSRTRDGSQKAAPRELIHLLNRTRDVQLSLFDVGEPEPDGDQLFTRSAIKNALPEVSKTRLEQTLYAEYPKLKTPLEKLRGEKSLQTLGSLTTIWGCSESDASALASELVSVGFFEGRGTKEGPEFWVPPLYRDGLDLVQGRAED